MPVGAKYGVEKTPKRKKGSSGAGGDLQEGGPTLEVLETSDRELARLFVEMFQPLGGENIAVVFNEAYQAEAAKKRWKGDSSARSNVLTLGRRKGGAAGKGGASGKKKKTKSKGFAAKLAEEMGDDKSLSSSGPFRLPDKTEVAIFVTPGPKELVIIEKICNEVGMGTLVILLNARLSRIDNFGTEATRELFLNEFESVFHLSSADQAVAPGCLLHRAYPGDWTIARKPKVGQPVVLGSSTDRPTTSDYEKAYESIEVDALEKTVDGVFETVTGWFG